MPETTLNRNIQPPLGKIERIAFSVPEPLYLENGLPLYSLNDKSVGITRIDWVSGSGFANEKTARSTFLSLEQITRGTSEWSSLQISEQLDLLGAYSSMHCGPDSSGFTIYSLSKNLEAVLKIWESLFLKASFPEDELHLSLSRHVESLKVSLEKTEIIAQRGFSKLLFGPDHPYGYHSEIEHYKSFNRSALSKNQWFTKGGYFLVSGSAGEKEINIISNTLGKLPAAEKATTPTPFESPSQQSVLISKTGSVQASLRMGKVIASRSDESFMSNYLTSVVLGGYFGSRLMKNIREDKGLTYGIFATVQSEQHLGRFTIGSDFKGELSHVVVNEIKNEMARLIEEPISDIELDTVKNYLLGGLLRSFDTVFGRADRLKNILFHKLNSDYYTQLGDFIQNFDGKQLQKTAEDLFNLEQLNSIIVGPKSINN